MSKKVTILADVIDEQFLPFVRRPSRYIGGEINQVKKDLTGCDIKVALCFPDIYEVAMSNTGLPILYNILNNIDAVAAERVFAPWVDAEKILRDRQIPLFSLESKASLKSFDVVGFSLTNELCYSNVLNMLDLGQIKVRSNLRSEGDPLIIAGGNQANCCEPIADFIDLFLLGEGEEAIVELIELIRHGRKTSATKKEILIEAAKQFDWAYVPAAYNSKLKIQNSKLHNAVVKDFENAPALLRPIVPFAQAVHERVSIEIMRGCPGRCRFCQASFCRRPVRYRSVGKIVDSAKAAHKSTGFDTISLLSLSTAEYPNLAELVLKLNQIFKDKHVGLSLPSLRVDQQLKLIPKLAASVRKSGLTIAVEAASENLRKIINKPLEDKDLFNAVEQAYKLGWQRLKLYFMAGLPGETEEDIKNIVHLSFQLAKLRKKIDGKTGQINITVSWLVPKPHTPFGWLAQRPRGYFENTKKLILDEKRKLRAKFLQFKFHDINQSILESALARGDRNLCDVIEAAWRDGAKFDLWRECFNYKIWEEAFDKSAIPLEAAAQRHFSAEEILPWEHLGGPDKKYLLGHLEQTIQQVKNDRSRS